MLSEVVWIFSEVRVSPRSENPLNMVRIAFLQRGDQFLAHCVEIARLRKYQGETTSHNAKELWPIGPPHRCVFEPVLNDIMLVEEFDIPGPENPIKRYRAKFLLEHRLS